MAWKTCEDRRPTRGEFDRAIDTLGLRYWFMWGAPRVDPAGKRTIIGMIEREVERARAEAEKGAADEKTSS